MHVSAVFCDKTMFKANKGTICNSHNYNVNTYTDNGLLNEVVDILCPLKRTKISASILGFFNRGEKE